MFEFNYLILVIATLPFLGLAFYLNRANRLDSERIKDVSISKPSEQKLSLRRYARLSFDLQDKVRAGKEFQEYFDLLIDYIATAHEQIVISDFVLHSSYMDNLPVEIKSSLTENYNRYFLFIENIVKENPSIQYTRIIYLPDTHSNYKSIIESFQNKTHDEVSLQEAATLVYSPALEHFKRLSNCQNFKLVIAHQTDRDFSSVLIDRKHWIQEQDMRVGEICRPYMLHVLSAEHFDGYESLINSEYSYLSRSIENSSLISVDALLTAIQKTPEILEEEVLTVIERNDQAIMSIKKMLSAIQQIQNEKRISQKSHGTSIKARQIVNILQEASNVKEFTIQISEKNAADKEEIEARIAKLKELAKN